MQADGERAQGAREEKTDLRFAWRNGTHKQICGLHGGMKREYVIRAGCNTGGKGCKGKG